MHELLGSTRESALMRLDGERFRQAEAGSPKKDGSIMPGFIASRRNSKQANLRAGRTSDGPAMHIKLMFSEVFVLFWQHWTDPQ